MIIFTESLVAALVLYFALSRKTSSDYRLIILVMSSIFIFSFIPSLSVPYIYDDVDHFNLLARAIDTHQIILWLMTPHNEHVMPLLKLLYLACYKYFWLNPEIFHVAVIAVCAGIIVLIYRLIFILTRSPLAAFIGASIMASTNLTDKAFFVGTNSHIFFCALLLLLLFYAIYRYAETQRSFWRYVAFFSILLVPSTFASGLTSIIFVVLFYRLCLPADLAQKGKNLFPFLLMGWLISLIPYVYSMNTIIHTKHYRDVGEVSVFGVARFSFPVQFLADYVVMKLIPELMANLYLSFGLFFLCFFTIIKYPKEINWKRISFFIAFGLFNNFIIYVFRSKWGAAAMETSRYDAFPVIMMAFSYALVLDIFVKQIHQINKVSVLTLVYVLCFFAVINGSLCRYSDGNSFFKKTFIMQSFYLDFRKAFVDYFHEHDRAQVHFRDIQIAVPFSRDYWRSSRFYAQYVLDPDIRKRIIWSKKTDPEFLQYLISHQYSYLTGGGNE